MREIEFRGWDKEWNQWVYGYYERIPVGIGHPIELIHVFMDWNLSSARKIEAGSVGQYTGVLDRYGKKIFDGDILTWRGDESRTDMDVFTVEWREQDAGFYFGGIFNPIDMKDCEIIGNLYEKKTPEEVS